MTRETYAQATSLIQRIEIVEVLLNAFSAIEEKTEMFEKMVDLYQKELDELNYKLYHLN